MTLMFALFFSCSWCSFRVLKVLFDYFFHTTITDVQYSRQLADSYPPVLPKTRSLFSPVMEGLGRRPWGSFSTVSLPFFKRTAPLIDTNIWQCLLTIPPLQSWADFWRFTAFFRQKFDYNALFHANMYFRFAHLPHNWQNCAVANNRLANYLGTVLPPSTYYYFQRTSLQFWTTNKL